MSKPFTDGRPSTWLSLAACLLTGAVLSVALGQEASWDTRNYHLYNPWAWLNRRHALDLAPGGLPSYFNPLPDVPYYLLATGPAGHWPRVVAALQGMWFGGLLHVLWRIAHRLSALRGLAFGWGDRFAVLIGASGTMLIAQTGSTANEVPMAMLTLLGLYILMPLYLDQVAPLSWRRAFGAGLCCGLAAGLKPTAVVYPPAMAIALLITLGLRRQAWRLAGFYAAGACLAFAVAYGWWGWHLYQFSGNPVFPIFNQIFRSDLVAPISATDGAFRPRSSLQWLFYPFFWLRPSVWVVTEARFADARYAAGMLAVLCIALVNLERWRRRQATEPREARVAGLLILFVSLAYLFWMGLFSILRYAIPIEALTGLLVLMAAQAVMSCWRDGGSVRPTAWAMGLLCVGLSMSTHYPQYRRTTYGQQVYEVEPLDLAPGSTVALLGYTNSYLVPFLVRPEGIRVVGVTWLTRLSTGRGLWSRTRERLLAGRHSLYAITRDDAQADIDLFFEFLPGYRFDECRPIRSNLEIDDEGANVADGLRLCRVVSETEPVSGHERQARRYRGAPSAGEPPIHSSMQPY